MKFSFLILLTILSVKAYSQKANLLLKFSPFELADDFSFPTISCGAEVKLSKKIGWYNEVGIEYRKSAFQKSDTDFVPTWGMKARTEFRYYFNQEKGSDFEGKYFAVNFIFIDDWHNTEISYYQNGDTSLIKKDAFGVKKMVWGFNFVYGQQIASSKKIYSEMYIGLGARYRYVKTINKEYNSTSDMLTDQSIDVNIPNIIESIDANGGFSPSASFLLGFRICYRL